MLFEGHEGRRHSTLVYSVLAVQAIKKIKKVEKKSGKLVRRIEKVLTFAAFSKSKRCFTDLKSKKNEKGCIYVRSCCSYVFRILR